LRAGSSICGAFDELWKKIGTGELGNVRDIEDLSWDALESVLLAERCALHDPARAGPHDRLAAMMHLGRAVEEAPEARFPAGRLAAFALDAGTTNSDAKLSLAARRALTRAIEDAPSKVELIEATAALELRANEPAAAEERLARAALAYPEHRRLHALLSEARRAQKKLDGALDAIHTALAVAPDDPILLTERGAVMLQRGDAIAALADWQRALELGRLFPPAYVHLASLALDRKDARSAEELVDRALLTANPHPEVLKKAIHLSLTMESDGIARAARLARLARGLLAQVPEAWGYFVLARAEAQLGEREAAAEHLATVESSAPGTTITAEAQRGRFALKEPQVTQEIESLLRAAYTAAPQDLETLAARGRRIAQQHPVWPAEFALGVVERRRERWQAARDAFEAAIAKAPGCTPAHLELVAVAVATRDTETALRHATTATALEGETARTLAVLATALLSAGRIDDARIAVRRALALDPDDASFKALADRIERGSIPPARSSKPPGSIGRVSEMFKSWFKF
jgi:tetratricopeptide (TPR) repeat protein